MTPKLVALCGIPQSGKSTLQNILQADYGLLPWDDGAMLRDHVQRVLGLTHEDVETQTGKLRVSRVNGIDWQHRKALGQYGQMLERMFGKNIIPTVAIREALEDWDEHFAPVHNGYSFGSVRMTQAEVYKRAGGIIVEIVRPGVQPTGNDFDEYDRSLVDVTVANPFDNTADLANEVAKSGLREILEDSSSNTCKYSPIASTF